VAAPNLLAARLVVHHNHRGCDYQPPQVAAPPDDLEWAFISRAGELFGESAEIVPISSYEWGRQFAVRHRWSYWVMDALKFTIGSGRLVLDWYTGEDSSQFHVRSLELALGDPAAVDAFTAVCLAQCVWYEFHTGNFRLTKTLSW